MVVVGVGVELIFVVEWVVQCCLGVGVLLFGVMVVEVVFVDVVGLNGCGVGIDKQMVGIGFGVFFKGGVGGYVGYVVD